MTRTPAQILAELAARREKLVEESERIADAIDKMPTEELHKQLREVTREIDRLNQRVEEARR